MTLIIAPFSNSTIRDWPGASFSALIGRLLEERRDDAISVVGTRSQALRANAIVRAHPFPRVRNDCGRDSWPRVVDRIRSATCVIGNNSGIAHVAARLGVPTVCIFGGSHHRYEWRPTGPNVIIVSRAIWCSPCHIDHRSSCRYDKACLRDIAVAEVMAAVEMAIAGTEKTGESFNGLQGAMGVDHGHAAHQSRH